MNSQLPPTGLLAEASTIVKVVQAERDVHIAEQRLARCHIKESLLKARLYKIQDAMAKRLAQISSGKVNRARAGMEMVTENHVRPQILKQFIAT